MDDGQEPASCTAPNSLDPGRRQGPTSCTVPDTLDFPAINEEYRGRPYCFVWGWTARNYSRIVLIKKNLCTGLLKNYLVLVMKKFRHFNKSFPIKYVLKETFLQEIH
jgi:hypothetical protein